MELRELLAGGPGHDGYAYQADTYCCECGRAIIKDLHARGAFKGLGADDLGDSDTCPQPIFFGEHPERKVHCADCGEYLYGENPAEVGSWWYRAGDADDYRRAGSLADLADELHAAGVRGPLARENDYGVSADGFRGQNYVSVYFGPDAESPARGLTDDERAELSDLLTD